MKTIPIVFCSDNKYAIPTYLAIYSLLLNYKGYSPLDVYIIKKEGDLDEYNNLFDRLKNEFGLLNLKYINIGTEYDKVNISSTRITTATMYRLMIPRLINADKCLYLDTDIIVEGDVSELLNINIDGYCIAGVRDSYLSLDDDAEYSNLLQIPSMRNYLNAGVLLINIEKIKKRYLADVLVAAGYNSEFPYNDQDAINSVFYDDSMIIPLRFNVMMDCVLRNDYRYIKTYGWKNVLQARRNPVVCHYISHKKPWIYKYNHGSKIWWKYVNMQEEVIIKDYIAPFVKDQAVNWKTTILEIGKDIFKVLGVFPYLKRSSSHQPLKKTL